MAYRPEIQIDARQVDATLKAFPAIMAREARGAMNDVGRIFTNKVITSFRPRTSVDDKWLQVRTGFLRNNVGFTVTGTTLADLQLKCYIAGVIYANIHEYGGIIRAKPPLKYLTVPMPDNLTPAGVPRFPSAAALRIEFPKVKGATEYTKVVPGKGGKGLYIIFVHKGRQTEWLWSLRKSVKIPARLGFRRTWNEQKNARKLFLINAINRAASEAVRVGINSAGAV